MTRQQWAKSLPRQNNYVRLFEPVKEGVLKQELHTLPPFVIGAVVSQRDGAVNLCPVTYQAVSTFKYDDPFSVCIGLSNESYTLETVLLTLEFVYAYPSRDQLEDILFCGTVSAHKGNKLEQTKLSFVKSKKIGPPLLEDSVLNFECRVVHHYNLGNFTIVVGKVLDTTSSGRDNLDKIYAMGNEYFGVIKEVEVLQTGRRPAANM